MTLSTPETIELLLDPGRRTACSRRPGRETADGAPPAARPAKGQRQCRCGRCARCLDNARWEQIFQEKFADPDYYNRRWPHHGSSLVW